MPEKYQVLRPSGKEVVKKFGDIPLTIAEIGVREGENTITMLKNMPVKHIYMIDSYEPYYSNESDHSSIAEQDIWYKNMFYYMTPYLSTVTFITKPSKYASELFKDEFFDYAYIDANHSSKCLYEDMTLWYPKVKIGGFLGGHDMDNPLFPNVPHVVRHFCDERRIIFKSVEDDWIIEKLVKKEELPAIENTNLSDLAVNMLNRLATARYHQQNFIEAKSSLNWIQNTLNKWSAFNMDIGKIDDYWNK